MKRYIIISTLIHVLCFFAISLRIQINVDSKDKTAETTTVEIVEEKPETKPETKGASEEKSKKQAEEKIKVVELVPGSQGEPMVLKDFYWGIGIDCAYIMLDNRMQACKITAIYAGYSADSSGLMLGDLIYSVNGGNIALNDIKGKEPAHLMLGVVRGSQTIVINLDRVMVYY